MGAFGGAKAPLISLLPIPFYWTFGNNNVAVMATLMGIAACGLMALFLLAREIFGRAEAALAVVITALMPATFGLARDFLVDFGLMTLVVFWLYLVLRSNLLRKRSLTIAVGAVTGLGLLMKASFPLYIAGPLGLILYRRLRAEGFNLVAWLKDGLIMLGAALLIASIWYVPNLKSVVGFATSTSIGSIAEDYSFGNPLDPFIILRYFREVLNHGISVYFGLLLAGFLIMFLIRTGRRVDRPARDRQDPKCWPLLISWILLPLVVTALAVNKSHRYLLPAVPAIGFGISYLLFTLIRSPKLRAIIIPLALVLPAITFVNVTFPNSPWGNWYKGDWMLLSEQFQFATRPVDQPWPLDQIVQGIAADAFASERLADQGPRFVAVIPDNRFINANNLGYRSAALHLPVTFGASYTQTEDSTLALKRLGAADYVLTKSGDQGPEFLTVLSKELNRALNEGRLPFSETQRWPLPDGSVAILFSRIPGK